jgi:hypothetical protein
MGLQERSNVSSNQNPPNFNLLIFINFNSEFEGTLGCAFKYNLPPNTY